MKILIPKRRWSTLLMLGVTLASLASAAVAGGSYGSNGGRRGRAAARCEAPRVSASFSWRSGDFRSAGFGDYGGRSRGYDDYGGRSRGYVAARPMREEACAVDHLPHVWYDGRLWCSGKNADGSWRGPWHCEDEYGRKKVNLPSFDPGCERWVH